MRPRTAVARYLAALCEPLPSMARARRSLEISQRHLAAADDVLVRVAAVQARLDAQAALDDALAARQHRAALEADFVEVAATWADTAGITWPAWREAGVPAVVLRAAGVQRTAPARPRRY